MTKKKENDEINWEPVKPGITSDLVREPGLVVIVSGMYHHFKDYWSMLDWLAHETLDISVNSPEEYDVLDAEERKKLEAVHAAWFPKL